MKRIFVILFSTLMIISLIACNGANNENTAPGVQSSEKTQQTEIEKMKSTEWPTNTIYPKLEGCTIIEVRSEDWKNYITVVWDNKETAKNYINIVKQVEGDTAKVIGQGETDESIYYGTYNITVTSINEAENIVLYK